MLAVIAPAGVATGARRARSGRTRTREPAPDAEPSRWRPLRPRSGARCRTGRRACRLHPHLPRPPAAGNGKTFVSPVVARIAAEHGIDPSAVPGTGTGGRVTKKDILTFIESGAAAAPPPAPPRRLPPPLPLRPSPSPQLRSRRPRPLPHRPSRRPWPPLPAPRQLRRARTAAPAPAAAPPPVTAPAPVAATAAPAEASRRSRRARSSSR